MILPHQNKYLAFVAVFIVAAAAGMFFRLYPVTHNASRTLSEKARLEVYVAIRKTLTQKIERENPSLSGPEKTRLLNEQFRRLIIAERSKIDNAVRERSLRAKEPESYYLLEADPYYYYRLTKKLLETGSISTVRNAGQYLDQLMLAPNGCWRKIEIHPYIGAWFYRIVHLIQPQISLMRAVAAVPLMLFFVSLALFIGALAVFDIRGFTAGIAAFAFSCAPMYINRSSFGWFDTDPYNVIFPVLIIATLCMAVTNKGARWPYLLAFIISLYAITWQGWITLAGISCTAFIAVTAYALAARSHPLDECKKFAVFACALIVFLIIILNPSGFTTSVKETGTILSQFLLFDRNIWPDIFITVGELKPASLHKIISLTGGTPFFWTGLAGFALFAVRNRRDTSALKRWVILATFYITTLILARSAERFIIFFFVPAAFAFALGVDESMRLILKGLNFAVKNNAAASIAAHLIMCLFLITPAIYAHAASSGQRAIYNDVWDAAFQTIRESTPQDSIVTSWWPPGHFITAMGERRTTFDGATLDTPQAYWVASALLSDNEREALGILRMLNTSGNNAAEFLTRKGMRLSEAVAVIKKIVLLDRAAARAFLSKVFPSGEIETLLAMTHGAPPASYIFLYNDLIDGVLGLHYVKSWDFRKAEDLQKKLRDGTISGATVTRGSSSMVSMLWTIAGGPVFIGAEAFETSRQNDTVYFQNSVVLNTKTMEARVNQFDKNISGTPASVLFIENGELKERVNPESRSAVSVLFIKNDASLSSCVIAPAKILRSVLFRLYYTGGIGLKHFAKLRQEEDATNNTKIMLYETIW